MIKVLVKDLSTETIIDSVPFDTYESASNWVNTQMFFERIPRAYKIVEEKE